MEDSKHPNNHSDGLGVQKELSNSHFAPEDRHSPKSGVGLYDAFYYQHCCGSDLAYSRNEPHWLHFFGDIAAKIIRGLGPGSVLDAGCAHGFLVESLRDRGVEAYGIDVSEYAISQVRPDIQPYCKVASLTEPLSGHYDLIVCIEVLEHLSPSEAESIVKNFSQATSDVIFSSTPDDFAEPTHQNVQEPDYWASLFARYGFVHDLEFDASFITGWAMRFRKTKDPLPTLVQSYERQLWRTSRQLQTVRAQLLNSRTEKAEKEQALIEQQKLQAELIIANQATEQLQAELLELRQFKTSFEPELARQQQVSEEALTNFKVAQARFRQMERERDKQVQVTKQLEAEAEHLKAEAEHLKAETNAQLEQSQTRLEQVGQEINIARRRIQQLEQALTRQAGQLSQVRREVEQGQQQHLVQASQLIELQQYARRLEQEREVLLVNLARFEQDLRALQATRTVRTASTLGKIVGGPLRLVKTTLRGPLEGGIDQPAAESTLQGVIQLAGWAYSSVARIAEIQVRLDEVPLGLATYGVARPDVVATRPWQLVANCGFEATLELDRQQVAPGPHLLSVQVSDLNGNTQLYTRSVIIAYPHLTPAIIPAIPLPPFVYSAWIERNEPDIMALEEQRRQALRLDYRPLFSILTPVYNTPPVLLQAAIESVLQQTYPNWEMCLVNGASTDPAIQALLEEYAAQDRRVLVKQLPKNEGISGNTNQALAMASGEFMALLDHDDEISPNALYEAALLLNAHPQADMVYSDEDKYDPQGQRCLPFFKPDWSPDLLRSQMYTCHLGFYRTALVKKLGGFRSQFDGAQDYDLVLRLTEQTKEIYHIAKILYHWRMSENSTASGSQAKKYTTSAQLRAMQEHCQRLGLTAVVEPGLVEHTLRVRRVLTTYPKVSIIIPTRDRADLLRQCIESIQAFSTYPNYEIIVVDNDSQEQASLEYFSGLNQQPNIEVVSYPHPFNFSALNNFGAAQAQGELLLLLNNDIEVISPGWLEAMVEHAIRPEVGAVGAKLLYPDGKIQHAGVIIGVGGVAGHSHKYLLAAEPGYFSRTMVIQNLSAVTGACMMVRAEVYRDMGGLDEKNLAVAFNDVDFCLRLRAKGYLLVWTPYATLYHHESVSRGLDTHPEKALRFQGEAEYMLRRWDKTLTYDPYYNPNLSLECEDFAIAPLSRATTLDLVNSLPSMTLNDQALGIQ